MGLKDGSEILSVIDNIHDIFKKISDNYSDNNIDFNLVMSLIDGLSKLATEVAISYRDEIDLYEFNDKLNNMLKALEDKDYDYFIDLYNYELMPLLEYWKEIIGK